MSVIDFTDTIIAKSDQLNASDIAGSLTITITDAKKIDNQDQPVHIFYDGCNGKPWKPCKTMRRVMAQVWGSKVDLKGRSVTLICDPKVTWGGAEVGGIRITHMSDIDGMKMLPVRISKHKVEKYKVLPITSSPKPQATTVDTEQIVRLGDEASILGVEAYKTFLAGLSAEEKGAIRHKHNEWSAAAKAADAEEELAI